MSSTLTKLPPALRGMFELRPAPPRRWLFSLRAACCMGAPILAGLLYDDVSAGLMASIGGFTSLYGSGRPYLNRARILGAIALGFALAVSLGMWVKLTGWMLVPTIALIAMVVTWLCNAWKVEPPGAYLLVLACAAATAMPAAHLGPLLSAMLVLGGGLFAWLVHMAGALFSPRGPERSAVTSAGRAVAAYIQAVGTPHESAARHVAAFALQRAWSVLVDLQPWHARTTGVLAQLRMINQGLHLDFAEAMGAASRNQPPPAHLLADTRQRMDQVAHPQPLAAADSNLLPLDHPSALAAMINSLSTDTNARRVIIRVGVAALVAGTLGWMAHFERAYWAIAASVLMLHSGFDWPRTIQRSVERAVGTWVGLLLAAVILTLYPQGVWLMLTVMALQFTIEMLVLRNYAIAAMFITCAALTIASGGHRVDPLGSYLLERGVDTLAGCVVALLVFRLIPPRSVTVRIPEQLIATLRTIDKVVAQLATGKVATPAAKAERKALQNASFALAQVHEDSLVASRRQRRGAEQMWPAIAATERLAYRVLSTCWAIERIGGEAARCAAHSIFGDEGAAHVRQTLQALAVAVHNGSQPPPPGPVPNVFEAELHNLHECLTQEPPEAVLPATDTD